jgi:hypothetical protein
LIGLFRWILFLCHLFELVFEVLRGWVIEGNVGLKVEALDELKSRAKKAGVSKLESEVVI